MIPSLGIMLQEQIIKAGLLDRQAALPPKVLEDYRNDWRRLERKMLLCA